jgi:signal transduction histidine kinase
MSVERIRVLTEQVVDVTRGQTGRPMPIRRSQLDLADIAADILIETRIRHPDVNLELQMEDGSFAGQWDGGRMGQLFSNLLANAVQYGSHLEPVVLRLGRSGDMVMAEVRNRGRVIPPADRGRIFDALSRGTDGNDEARRTEGLGLGLYICKEIVLAHGGSIDVQSDAGEGTRFIVELPVIR